LTEELIKQHSVVVLTNSSLEEQKRINKITHDSGKASTQFPYPQLSWNACSADPESG
jgi:hypothetical protein